MEVQLCNKPLHSQLYFVGTGTGVVPLRSMLCELAASGEITKQDVTILLGFRSPSDAIHFEQFEALAAEHNNVEFIPTFSEPEAAWPGARGYVTQHLKQRNIDVTNMQIYLSGNGAMIGDVIDLLHSKGLTRQSRRIICEKFFDRPRVTSTQT